MSLGNVGKKEFQTVFHVVHFLEEREIMSLGGIDNIGEEKVFLVSTTHGAESTGLAAMMETIRILKRDKAIEYSHRMGSDLQSSLREKIQAQRIRKARISKRRFSL